MRRRSPRAVLLWVGAVLVAIVTAVIVATDLAALHNRARGLGPARPVAAAVRDLAVACASAAVPASGTTGDGTGCHACSLAKVRSGVG